MVNPLAYTHPPSHTHTHTHTSQGHLLLPGVDSSLCEFIPSVDVNLTLIAFVKSFYNCPLDLEHNIYNAGYSALLVYTPLSDIILTSKTNLPRAMFSSMVSSYSSIANPRVYN